VAPAFEECSQRFQLGPGRPYGGEAESTLFDPLDRPPGQSVELREQSVDSAGFDRVSGHRRMQAPAVETDAECECPGECRFVETR
jgi:hypothetical protein